MDYEHDALATPRITGVIDTESRSSLLGVVRRDGLEVREVTLRAGTYQYVSTYEHNYLSEQFSGDEFNVASAKEAADFILRKGAFAELSNAITSGAILEAAGGHQIAFLNSSRD
jgi:IMP cyclohydrolase